MFTADGLGAGDNGFEEIAELLSEYSGMGSGSGASAGAANTNHDSTRGIVDQLNAEFAFAMVGGSAVVLNPHKDPTGRTVLDFLKPEALRGLYANQGMKVKNPTTGNLVWKNYADIWWTSPKRRQFRCIGFYPGMTVDPSTYNLWQGFSVEPKATNCSRKCRRFLAHMFKNICHADHKSFRWLLGWMAQLVQHPDVKVGVALALVGEMGVGKTKFGEGFGSLIHDHYLVISNAQQLLGKHNKHLAGALLIQAEEAVWAGDKHAEGILKDIITGKELAIEPKFVDPIMVANYLRLLAIGNPGWVVPVSFNDRRWVVFEVRDANKEDHAYFAAIDAELDNGGREALLHLLQNLDLTKFDIWDTPKTEARSEQQLRSMSMVEKWWYDCLKDGAIFVPSHEGSHDIDFDTRGLKEDVTASYLEYARVHGGRSPLTNTALWTQLRKMLPDVKLTFHQPQGNRVKKCVTIG